MYRYFIHLAYKGNRFHGWQIQPNAITVQELLNKALRTLIGEEIETTGAGRTDTGVHALSFYAHFDSSFDNLHEKTQIVYKLNCILPADIVVFEIYKMKPDAHARFDAISRTYLYRLSKNKNPFNQEVTMQFWKPLDINLMNKACEKLMTYTDFTSFSKVHTDVKTNNCAIFYAKWVEVEDELHFEINANRFLRNMVRAVVGTLLLVGLKKIDLKQFCEIIEKKNRSEAGISVEAQGLHLSEIIYPPSFFV